MLKKVKKLWGSEEWLVNNEKYCAKFLNLEKGFKCSLHSHKKKDETFYVLEGRVLIEGEGNTTTILYKNGSIRIKPGEVHRFYALTERAKILEVSTHHDDEDSYRLEKSRKIE